MESQNSEIKQLEQRLAVIERRLGIGLEPNRTIKPLAQEMIGNEQRIFDSSMVANKINTTAMVDETLSTTRMMGWCAGITFVLAIIYFLNLVYTTGWLTPIRQILLAYAVSAGLILAGLVFKTIDRYYSAYLPAIGLVGLYLTTFSADLYYGLFHYEISIVLVCVITLIGIWLGRSFNNSVYTIFSAVCVYIAPMLLNTYTNNLISLIIYYSAWSLLFSFCAIYEGRRISYVIPMFLSILGFDLISRMTNNGLWQLTAFFQLLQFIIFSATTVLFTYKRKQPLSKDDGYVHLLALVLIYGIEYLLLEEHIPSLVNIISIASAIVVFCIYQLAKCFINDGESIKNGALICSAYCSLVTFHAVFFGVLNNYFFTWSILTTIPIFLYSLRKFSNDKEVLYPIAIACVTLFCIGYGNLMFIMLLKQATYVPMPILSLVVYSILLYVMYFELEKKLVSHEFSMITLYAGHWGLVVSSIHLVKGALLSGLWGFYGLVLLVLAMKFKNRLLGQSAVVIFAAASLKVLLFDLSNTNSMVRVCVLLVLSICMYAGGWMYQKLMSKLEIEKL